MAEVFSWRDAPAGDFAVIGDPVAHSKSPSMHAAAYRVFGLDLTYRAIHVPEGETAPALDHLKGLGYRGVNATLPHKEAALAWSDSCDPVALAVGAANVIDLQPRDGSPSMASNSDVFGFSRSLEGSPLARLGREPSTLVLGAGGSAAAVLFARLGGNVALWNRSKDRARMLLEGMDARLSVLGGADAIRARLKMVWDLSGSDPNSVLNQFDLVVNATSASLKDEDVGVDWTRAAKHALAYDLAYGVDEAPFLRGAREAGLATMDGREMLAWQGAGAFYEWGLTGAYERGPDAVYPAMRGALT